MTLPHLWLFILLLGFQYSSSTICSYCSSYHQSKSSNELLKDFCKHGNHTGRCCWEGDKMTGLDCSNCEFNTLNLTDDNKTAIHWLALNGNSSTDWNIRSLTDLSTLVLSLDEHCGEGFNVSKTHDNLTICTQPINGCHTVDCPTNSHCLRDGPGLFMCSCNDTWKSYRCLHKDNFPAVEWLIGFAVATVVICFTLRLMQRKGRQAGMDYEKLFSKTIGEDPSLNRVTPTFE